eukprot:354704-Chlamydomonas_euryale.AAC.1
MALDAMEHGRTVLWARLAGVASRRRRGRGKTGRHTAGTEGALGTDAQPDRGEGVRLARGGAAERGAPASGAGQPARAQRVR